MQSTALLWANGAISDFSVTPLTSFIADNLPVKEKQNRKQHYHSDNQVIQISVSGVKVPALKFQEIQISDNPLSETYGSPPSREVVLTIKLWYYLQQ